MNDPHSQTAISRTTMESAKASYERCLGQEAFFETFYQTFFRNCPPAVEKFANTDFERQHKLLRHAIGLLLIFPGQEKEEPNLLTRLAERHSRNGLDVSPELYRAFVDSLMETVAVYDPEFGSDVEAAWRATVSRGITYMQSKY